MFVYRYGAKFREANPPNLDKCISKANENIETRDKRKVLGTISIHVGDLLISGGRDFIDYISWGMGETFDVGRYRGKKETYLGVGIIKKSGRLRFRRRNFRFRQF